jgi:hypothetical protein
MTYKATVLIAGNTGYIPSLGKDFYLTGFAVTMSNSPKKAIETAKVLAETKNCDSAEEIGLPRGMGTTPIWYEVKLMKNDKLIYHYV